MQERRIGRRVFASALTLVAIAATLAVVAAPAQATTFTNTNQITIPSGAPGTTSGQSNPFPSVINVTGLTGNMTDVNVSLLGVQHTFPEDVDIVLVAPGGQKVLLMAGAGGGLDVNAGGITFDQSAAGFLPDSTQINSGSYRPSAYESYSGPSPAGPFSSTMSVFNGVSGNGFWLLYVYDDAGGDTGRIASGWRLDISTGPVVNGFNPTSGQVGSSVTISGLNFSGATLVQFGGVPATTFTVNSDNQITATVPSGALTGPITVTTANGTGSSAASFTVTTTPPTITSFAPLEGLVGQQVTITGTALNGATQVTFNGTVATSFSVNGSTQITAQVPPGASTGLIQVTTPGGVGASTDAFVVRHKRQIQLDVSGNKAKGRVDVLDEFAPCADGVKVTLKLDDGPGGFSNVGSDITTATGRFVIPGSKFDGRYRAEVLVKTLASGDICNKRVQTESKS